MTSGNQAITPGGEVITMAVMVLYLYVVGPLISHITALGSWTAYLPGVAADGLTQAKPGGRAAAAALGGPAWRSPPGPRRRRRRRPQGHHLTQVTR